MATPVPPSPPPAPASMAPSTPQERSSHGERWASAFGLTFAMRKQQRQRYAELKERLVFRIDALGETDPLSASLFNGDDGASDPLQGSTASSRASNAEADAEPSSWDQYFSQESLLQEINTDLDRLYPAGLETFFQNDRFMDILRNVLFVWCKLHPDVSYRQGMHDVAAVVLFAFLLHRPVDTRFGHGIVVGFQSDQVTQVALDGRNDGATLFSAVAPALTDALPEFLEADTFLVFEAIMVFLKPFYEVVKSSFSKDRGVSTASTVDGDLDSANACEPKLFNNFQKENEDPNDLFGAPVLESPVQSMQSPQKTSKPALHRLCHHIQYELLREKDPQLYYHLQNMDIVPETYCLRWIRLLFAREFPLDKLLIVWDGMILDTERPSLHYGKAPGPPALDAAYAKEHSWLGFPLLRHICVARLVNMAAQLRRADNTGCLRLLMHSSVVGSATDESPLSIEQRVQELVRFARVLQDPRLEKSQSPDIRVVQFDAGSLGIILSGARKPYADRIAVKEFVPDPNAADGKGQAEATGMVQVGDFVESINGVPVIGVTTEGVKRHIQLIPKPMYMSFRRLATPAEMETSSSSTTNSTDDKTEDLEVIPHFLSGERCFAKVDTSIQRFTVSNEGACMSSYVSGKLYITNYRCFFCRLMTQGEIEWQIPVLSIASIDGMDIGSPMAASTTAMDHAQAVLGFAADDTYKVAMRCKDTQVARFSFSNYGEYSKLFKCISCLAFPASLLDAFCFAYNPEVVPSEEVPFDIRREYERIGLLDVPNRFRCIDQTPRYELCDTYPQHLIVPTDISDLKIKNAATFRSHNRLPVVAWLHRGNGATISRSSQPMVGLKSNRCVEDELLVRLICCSGNQNSFGRYVIMDARGQLAAVGNKAMGKGTEIPANYRGSRIVFMNIENIHAIRQSFQSLTAVFEPKKGFNDDSTSFYGRIENSGWLRHVRLVLKASAELALSVNNGVSVLTHCSDGWDRTAQMVSLAELMLDPYYRTLRGFQALIEKEWCSFGHQFAARCGHARSDATNDQRSPVFLMWLDCVWQFLRQFPSECEFNECLLLALADHIFSCKYGTFMFDCERQRKELFAKHRVFSIWSEINCNSTRFLNERYAPSNTALLVPSTISKNIKCALEGLLLPLGPHNDTSGAGIPCILSASDALILVKCLVREYMRLYIQSGHFRRRYRVRKGTAHLNTGKHRLPSMVKEQFSEIVALIRRNEDEAKDIRDVEEDLKRLLLMSRDTRQRELMVQAQAIKRITSIHQSAKSIVTKRYCAGILGNMAHSEKGRLGVSSCERYGCVSHRHACPLFQLLFDAQTSPDKQLQHISAAAALSFSIQNECQLQLDNISGIHVLLRLLDVDDAELRVYAAAMLWNMIKSPLLLLKLESLHGVLKEPLLRKLSEILKTPLEPFRLAVRQTNERGAAVIIESDGENLNLLITASISATLAVILHIETYLGPKRTMNEQFQTKLSAKQRREAGIQSQSVAQYDESGVLVIRTCAVCDKAIRVTKKANRGKFLLCAKAECGQTYHVECSRWRTLAPEDVHAQHFHCDRCVQTMPLYYWDFVALNPLNTHLLTENLFKSAGLRRVLHAAPTGEPGMDTPTGAGTDDQRKTSWTALLGPTRELVGVGTKEFRVAASSTDDEMFVVTVAYTLVSANDATQQQSSRRAAPPPQPTTGATKQQFFDWHVSYAREEAKAITFEPGRTVFWPTTFALDVVALRYADQSLAALERAFVYEFAGQDKRQMFAIGPPPTELVAMGGLWTTLHPRKGICMKMLTEQLGRAKQLQETPPPRPGTASSTPTSISTDDMNNATNKERKAASKRPSKPHITGKTLKRVDTPT
ncbi:TPA: hypothetical protein N0F65_009433 [Lagenidium giganteum]|uniref:Phosphatidylinositol-3-phosphatase n=1 Tax=Lagenidium giganteum TaxID=4803 RepID=A0AAV2ZCR9_9STRA|nr:TPA: hypothetical protein N0F65_009433 [Lagenidium giganteum]